MDVCKVDDCEKPRYRSGRGYCQMHYERLRRYGDLNRGRPTLEQRFWPKVNKDGPNGCWIWTASLTGFGYGQIIKDGKITNAHRVAYELVVGPIPAGLELDHLCRVPACVNPAHLEPVTHRENLARALNSAVQVKRAKTHCPQGHPYSGDNLVVNSKGRRECRICRRDSERRRRQRRKP